MPAVAVTDRNNLFGALEFAQYAAKAGIQPIIGCDLGIRREDEGGIATAGKLPATDWLTLLVQSEQGYLNLMRLVSRAHLEFKTGSTDGAAARRAGRLAPRGCWPDRRAAGSVLGRLLGGGQAPAAAHHARAAAEAVRRPALYRAAAPRRGRSSAASKAPLLDLAYAHGLPLVGDQRRALSPRPRCTRRTTCCSASSRARISRTPTAGA